MSIDAIQRVKEAEDQARQIVENARIKASQIVEEGKKQTQQQYLDILAQSKESRKQSLERARQEGVEMASPILERANSDADRIRAIQDEDLRQIVDSIVERIVK